MLGILILVVAVVVSLVVVIAMVVVVVVMVVVVTVVRSDFGCKRTCMSLLFVLPISFWFAPRGLES